MKEAEKIYLTKEGYRELLKEKEKIAEQLKVAKAGTVPTARSEPGNLWHDNAAFEQAEREVDRLTAQLRELKNQLASAEVVDPKNASKDRVGIGSKLKLRIDGKERTCQMVGWGEADPEKGKFSYASPIGKAILRAKPGDHVKVETPQGEISVEVIKIF